MWEAILPVEVRRLSGELALVDELLDDPSFWEPFRPYFDPAWGRPSIPIETYLRMVFLRYRYRLGYERLCVEIADSISWQIFCRIPVGADVPAPSTLAKITRRIGDDVVREVNGALLLRAADRGLVDLSRVRADTTVVEANVAYPTDSGLLAKGIRRIGRLVGRIKGRGAAARTSFGIAVVERSTVPEMSCSNSSAVPTKPKRRSASSTVSSPTWGRSRSLMPRRCWTMLAANSPDVPATVGSTVLSATWNTCWERPQRS